jgi:hypothetical protein
MESLLQAYRLQDKFLGKMFPSKESYTDFCHMDERYKGVNQQYGNITLELGKK